MRRREFITLLGGIAVASPLVARAQQPERMRRIGVLMNRTADQPEGQTRFAAFSQGLQEAGWAVGRNPRIDIRWRLNDVARFRALARELVALAPDVILAGGTLSVAALLQATGSVPIVFASVADPVGAGFVDSLARPGGNVTGFMNFEFSLSGKWLELLKETAPSVKRAAVLRDAANPAGIGQFSVIQALAPSLGIDVSVGQRARRRRDRTRRCGLRQLRQWWSDCDRERGGDDSSRSHHHARREAQAAHGLRRSRRRHRWRPGFACA